MSNLSELLPAGGAAKEFEPVASGTLPNGQAVVLKSNGQVEVVSETTIAADIPAGTAANFVSSAETYYVDCAFDPNTANKFVIAYRRNTSPYYGRGVVGTISGNSISFGTEYVFHTGTSGNMQCAFDPNTAGKFVITYLDASNSYHGMAVVGTISGTDISFNTKYAFNAGNTDNPTLAFNPSVAGQFVVVYKDEANSDQGTAIIGTISGTSISFGSEAVFDTSTISRRMSPAFDANTSNKLVITYSDNGNSFHGTAIVGTVSGTSLSFGTAAVFNAANTNSIHASFDPNTAGKFVITYRDDGNSYVGTAIIGIISGTSISFGSEAIFHSAQVSENATCAFDPINANQIIVCYANGPSNNTQSAKMGTVSGTTISFGSENTIISGNVSDLTFSMSHIDVGKFVVAYKNGGSNSSAIICKASYKTTNAADFVGITAEAITSGATGVVVPQGGVATNLSSLTIGSNYYVQSDGTVSTVSTSPAVNIGKAISATSLILKG